LNTIHGLLFPFQTTEDKIQEIVQPRENVKMKYIILNIITFSYICTGKAGKNGEMQGRICTKNIHWKWRTSKTNNGFGGWHSVNISVTEI
jgi:hypothetical protein